MSDIIEQIKTPITLLGSLIIIGKCVLAPFISKMQTRHKYERIVCRFFTDYVHYTHSEQRNKPHYEPSTTTIILCIGKTKSELMQEFNKDNSMWWTRYQLIRQMYDSSEYHDLITELCDKCNVIDREKFIKWVDKRSKHERSRRKIQAIKHNATSDLYESYKLKNPDIDYYEFML